MATTPTLTKATLPQLRAEAERRETSLREERGVLQERLTVIDAELNGHMDPTSPVARKSAPRRRTTTRKAKKAASNSGPLRNYILTALKSNEGGLPLKGLATQVRKLGYKTKSKRFENTIYQCIYRLKNVSLDKKTKNYIAK